MKFENAFIPVGLAWTSPFVRWQGSFAEISAIDLAVDVTTQALAGSALAMDEVTDLTFGITIPQPTIFYGAPTVAARLGAPAVTGPMIAQACATSVASLQWAASTVETQEPGAGHPTLNLVVAADRLSNGPHLVFPAPSRMGGSVISEDWVLDNFERDPWAGEPMIVTAEAVAGEAGFTREQVDDVCLMRHEQYRSYTESVDGRPPYMVAFRKEQRRGPALEVLGDEGIHQTTAEGLAALRPVRADGVVTFGTQTHPADGSAGAVVTTAEKARELSTDGVARILSTGVARADAARMPKAPVPAAQRALSAAGLRMNHVDVVGTHNPFAVNDLYFAREMDWPLDKMNQLGCSLVYGHPQAATGLRGVAELIEVLRQRGGGIGLFTGCAAGDTAAALILEVTD
jgi:acetyl-CoA C-acetyltransferase